MKIDFVDRRLEKQCNDEKKLVRAHGAARAKRLMARLLVLSEADNLAQLGPPYRGPMRCHELKGDRQGQLSVDLDHPYRLIFEPNHNPLPLSEDGGLIWARVTAIRIVEIADTHE